MLVLGPSQSGKTLWIRSLLKGFKKSFVGFEAVSVLKVVWCYGAEQKIFGVPISETVQTTYVKGLLQRELVSQIQPHVVVLDDLQEELGDTKDVVSLVTRDGHHRGMTVIVTVQDAFPDVKKYKTISRQFHYINIFKNSRDLRSILNFLKRINPYKADEYIAAYLDSIKRPYGSLLLYLHSATDEVAVVKSRVTVEDASEWGLDYAPVIYLPKKNKSLTTFTV